MGSDYSMVPTSQGHFRASSAERERAVDVLKAAFAEGRLDHEEYADRVERVYRSKTYAELAVLVADLPVGPLGTLGPVIVTVSAPPAALKRRKVYRRAANAPAQVALILGLGAFVTLGATALPAVVLGVLGFRRASLTRGRGRVMAAVGTIAGAAAIPMFIHLLYMIRSG